MIEPTVMIKTDPENKQIECQIWYIGEQLDRPCTYSICLPWNIKNAKLAMAFKSAVSDGKIYYDHCIQKDVYGKTYGKSKGFVMGKYLERTLKEIGYYHD